MFGLAQARELQALKAEFAALNKALAVIEFTPEGQILGANENFLKLMGYSLAEIQGRHHSMFMEPGGRDSADYRQFWDGLRRGEFHAAQYRRIGKGGREVWIEASYNPVADAKGRTFKVVKYATDVTRQKAEHADLRGKVNAIERSQAVIEFELDGTIRTANPNFLKALGYTLSEVQGRHHSMFLDAATRSRAEYTQFWERLRGGEYQAGQFKRVSKGGSSVWIEASYNPVLDLNGRPCKVVKFATDVTKQVDLLISLKSLIDGNFAEVDTAIRTSTEQTRSATQAAAHTSGDVQMVASSVEELSASIREISESMVKSREAAEGAFGRAEAADRATQQLVGAAQQMTGIVDLIRQIAGQINLLALNATIEAARAGEAGRGFAVVATEVKNLAGQAANATSQIAREIQQVQDVSSEVVGALTEIRGAIGTVREHVAGTAGAVEEQSAVTLAMSSTMQSAAAGVEALTKSIGEIAAAVDQVTHAVGSTKQAAEVLAR
ncbi:methyl-accepting chemotaxis protein [Indioceanicola profundi]|uniref:methyl-accepting chemotaxis protein n=1 Tax=Indioceanicola profundi TaxID=2220096 RepID=UPI000E6AD53F|nr:PAS domain-containing methyl-accepting chemotaxis protein [Indioceanicola profundi]